jgi:hypothetical protein
MVESAAALLEEHDILVAAVADRLHGRPVLDKLLRERRRHEGVGGDEDRAEGCVLRQPLASVADDDRDVIDPGERGAGRLGDVGETLDAEHLAREPREQRGLPAVAGADLEHALVAGQRERFDHPRDERGLRYHLPVGDRDRRVQVRPFRPVRGHEVWARHGRDRGQHALVFDSRRSGRCDQRVHAASMRPCRRGRRRASSSIASCDPEEPGVRASLARWGQEYVVEVAR